VSDTTSTNGTSQRARILVRGRVQGVFFRESTRQFAVRLGLVGWVANRPDDQVEIVVEGPRNRIEQLIEFAQAGPPGARVEGLECNWENATAEFDAFRIESD
jgi:acylphosphatase